MLFFPNVSLMAPLHHESCSHVMEEKNYTITIPGKLRVINIEASNLLVTTLVVTGGMKKKNKP